MGDSKDKCTFFILSHSWNITPKMSLPWSASLRKLFNAYYTIFPSLFAHSFLGSAWRCYLSVSGLMLKRFQVNFQRGFKISGDSILAQKTGNHDGWQWKAPCHTQIKYLSMNKQVGKIMPKWKSGKGVIDAQTQNLVPHQQTTNFGEKKNENIYIHKEVSVCVCVCERECTCISHTILEHKIYTTQHAL